MSHTLFSTQGIVQQFSLQHEHGSIQITHLKRHIRQFLMAKIRNSKVC